MQLEGKSWEWGPRFFKSKALALIDLTILHCILPIADLGCWSWALTHLKHSFPLSCPGSLLMRVWAELRNCRSPLANVLLNIGLYSGRKLTLFVCLALSETAHLQPEGMGATFAVSLVSWLISWSLRGWQLGRSTWRT